MATQKRRLGEILVTSGEITQSQLDQALAEQKTNGKRLGETLISLNFLTERKMLKTLEKQLSIPYMFLSDIEIMPEAVAAVPIFLAERYTLVPLKKDGNRLTIAMNDPTNFYAIDDVRMVSGCDISIVLSEQQDIINAINNFYGVSGRVGGSLNKLKEDSFAPVIRRVEDSSEDAPIIKIVNSVIEQAVRDKASDIHIEPQEDDTRVRFRVDGVLRNAVTLPKNSHSAIISRIKIMAEMDIAEKRLPQDGRINIEQGGRDIDLRISTLPTILGERLLCVFLIKRRLLLISMIWLSQRRIWSCIAVCSTLPMASYLSQVLPAAANRQLCTLRSPISTILIKTSLLLKIRSNIVLKASIR